jgi:hypothetical protein
MKFLIPSANPAYKKLEEKLSFAFETTFNRSDTFDRIITMSELNTDPIAYLADSKGVPFPDSSFCTKHNLKAKCTQAGVKTPESVELSLGELNDFSHPNFIIKPKYGSGGKNKHPAVYKIFSLEDKPAVVEYLSTLENHSDYLLQRAYINPETRETKLLFVDGAVNGNGKVFFNPIADKSMLDPTDVGSHITHKVGVRLVDFSDKYDFKENIKKVLAKHNIKNTLFKVQAIVDEDAGECLINDWSWGVMPYTHVYLLDAEYLCSQLAFAYDLAETVTKPIDTIICMKHLAMPLSLKNSNEEAFDAVMSSYEQRFNVTRVEPIIFTKTPAEDVFFCLYGVTCDSAEEGESRLNAFEQAIKGI